MGNCCTATPTSDAFSTSQSENPVPRASPLNVGVAGPTEGHMNPDSMPELAIPAESQQLEHMADREGKVLEFCITNVLIMIKWVCQLKLFMDKACLTNYKRK